MFHGVSISVWLHSYRAILIGMSNEILGMSMGELLPQAMQPCLSDVISEDNDITIGSLNYMSMALISEEELKSQCLNVIDVAVKQSKVFVDQTKAGRFDAGFAIDDNYEKRLTDLVGFINSFIEPILKGTQYFPSQIKHVTTFCVNNLTFENVSYFNSVQLNKYDKLNKLKGRVDKGEEDLVTNDLIRSSSTLSCSQAVNDICLSSSQESNIYTDTYTKKDLIMAETDCHDIFEENCLQINVKDVSQYVERLVESSQLEERVEQVERVDICLLYVCELYQAALFDEWFYFIISSFIFSSCLVLTDNFAELNDMSLIVTGRFHYIVSEQRRDCDFTMSRSKSELCHISTKDYAVITFQIYPMTLKRLLLSDSSSSVMEIANCEDLEQNIQPNILTCESKISHPSLTSFFNTIEQRSRVPTENIEDCLVCDRGFASLYKEKYKRTCVCKFLKSVFKALFSLENFKFVIDDSFVTHLLDFWLIPTLEEMRCPEGTEATRNHLQMRNSASMRMARDFENNSANVNEVDEVVQTVSTAVVRPAYHELFFRNHSDGIGIKYLLNIMRFIEELVVTWSGDVQIFEDVLPFLFRILDQLQSVLLYLAKKINEDGLMEICTSCIKDILTMSSQNQCPLCLLFAFKSMLHHVNQFGNFIFQRHFIRTRLSYSLYKVYRSYKKILQKLPEEDTEMISLSCPDLPVNPKSNFHCTSTDRRVKSIQGRSKVLFQLEPQSLRSDTELADVFHSFSNNDVRMRPLENSLVRTIVPNQDGLRCKYHDAYSHIWRCGDLSWADFKFI